MEYEKMSKEELIAYIRDCEKKRAFTYEDQMKLAFVDGSPFTIWASDRDCKIKFWAGQCEELYGYKKNEVIGKDFVDLFVAENEKKAAREDQISIIDGGAIFHNIANDIGKKGNTLRLLTNCWRMKPPGSDEYLNFEMGLIVDFYNQEVERLDQIVSESRILKEKTMQFDAASRRYEAQYYERRRFLLNGLKQCKSVAVRQKRKSEFEPKEEDIRKRINDVGASLDSLVKEYAEKIASCSFSAKCEEILNEFMRRCDDAMDEFDDAGIYFQEVSLDYEGAGSTEVSRSTLLRDIEDVYAGLHSKSGELKCCVDREVEYINVYGDGNKKSSVQKRLGIEKEKIGRLIERICASESEAKKKGADARSDEEMEAIRMEVRNAAKGYEDEIALRRRSLGGGEWNEGGHKV